MGDMPRPVLIRGFPDFVKSRYSSRILVQCMLNLVREGEEDYIEAIRYRRRLKIFENFLFFFRFVGQLLEHPVWRHLPLPAH